MAKVLINNQYLTNIGDAIREKSGSTATYKPSEMPDAIQSWYSINDYFVMGGLTGTYSNSKITAIGAGALAYQDIESVDLPNITELTNNCFRGCQNLINVNLPNVETINASYVFNDCSNLTTVFFPKLKMACNSVFKGCSKLDTLILGGETMVISDYGLGKYFLKETAIDNGNGYIYVRRALYDSYCNDTSTNRINWAQYKDQIRIIEDYPEYWALINWAGRDWATSTWEELSWSEVYGLCKSRQNGEIAGYPPYIQLGAVKNVDVNGVSVPMYLIGIDQDGVGVLTFQALEGYMDMYYGDYTDLSLVDKDMIVYEFSNVKAQCEIFYNNCEAKQYIKPLAKRFVSSRTYRRIQTEELLVWVPSVGEAGITIPSTATGAIWYDMLLNPADTAYQYFANGLYPATTPNCYTRSIAKFGSGDGSMNDFTDKHILLMSYSSSQNKWSGSLAQIGKFTFAPAFAIG